MHPTESPLAPPDAPTEIEELRSKVIHLTQELKKKDNEIKKLKNTAAIVQLRAEEEEEAITNKLMKRLEALRKGKAALVSQVQSEELHMKHANLKLVKLRAEKVDLENHLEMEQEYIVNKLQKQLMEVTRQKNALERQVTESKGGLLTDLAESVDRARDAISLNTPRSKKSAQNSLSQIELQIKTLREQQKTAEEECHHRREQCEQLVGELEQRNNENFLMKAKFEVFKAQLKKFKKEQEEMFARSETEKERQFNQTVRGGVPWRSRSASEVGPTRSMSATLDDFRARSHSTTAFTDNRERCVSPFTMLSLSPMAVQPGQPSPYFPRPDIQGMNPERSPKLDPLTL